MYVIRTVQSIVIQTWYVVLHVSYFQNLIELTFKLPITLLLLYKSHSTSYQQETVRLLTKLVVLMMFITQTNF